MRDVKIATSNGSAAVQSQNLIFTIASAPQTLGIAFAVLSIAPPKHPVKKWPVLKDGELVEVTKVDLNGRPEPGA